MSEELCFLPATDLARMIRQKAVSPVEVMRSTIERAQALNPRLNAICTPTYDFAMEAADAAEDLLTGLRLAKLARQIQDSQSSTRVQTLLVHSFQPLWEGVIGHRWTEPQLLPWSMPVRVYKAVMDLFQGKGWTGGFRSRTIFCVDVVKKSA